jgi:hypothetical protein
MIERRYFNLHREGGLAFICDTSLKAHMAGKGIVYILPGEIHLKMCPIDIWDPSCDSRVSRKLELELRSDLGAQSYSDKHEFEHRAEWFFQELMGIKNKEYSVLGYHRAALEMRYNCPIKYSKWNEKWQEKSTVRDNERITESKVLGGFSYIIFKDRNHVCWGKSKEFGAVPYLGVLLELCLMGKGFKGIYPSETSELKKENALKLLKRFK